MYVRFPFTESLLTILMHVLYVLYSLSSRPTHIQHIYIYEQYLYIVSTATCFDASADFQAVLSFCLDKVTKIITVTNSIKTVYQNVNNCCHYS